ncbi:SPOR domain-containing protein [Ascidiimonas aurantiaca]|uniref:SPOR domain-containing protein n=1 Tax=Ascidiimonas aurantiaca TaxID=1685432 RepID=UPI0030EEDE2B
MPYIEEEDLLGLHKKIEKEQAVNQGLLQQISYKSKEVKHSKKQKKIFAAIAVGSVVIAAIVIAYSLGVSKTVEKLKTNSENKVTISLDSIEQLRERIRSLQEKNSQLNSVHDFYLAKNLLKKQKVFAVQVGAFENNRVSLLPVSLNNTQLVRNNPYYSYSLGIFETLKEAQSFRFELAKLGFEDAFVVSYVNGKRIQVEEPY